MYLTEWNADFLQAGWARPSSQLRAIRQFFLLMVTGKFPLTSTISQTRESMNKHDWVFVGIRLLGVFFLAQLALDVPGLLQSLFDWSISFWWVILVLMRALVGWFLAFRTSTLCGWLGK